MFPIEAYGWFPHKNGKGPKAPLNSQGSRFGAGWNYRLGIDIGSSTVILNLLRHGPHQQESVMTLDEFIAEARSDVDKFKAD